MPRITNAMLAAQAATGEPFRTDHYNDQFSVQWCFINVSQHVTPFVFDKIGKYNRLAMIAPDNQVIFVLREDLGAELERGSAIIHRKVNEVNKSDRHTQDVMTYYFGFLARREG